jgi:hypothetical protein
VGRRWTDHRTPRIPFAWPRETDAIPFTGPIGFGALRADGRPSIAENSPVWSLNRY